MGGSRSPFGRDSKTRDVPVVGHGGPETLKGSHFSCTSPRPTPVLRWSFTSGPGAVTQVLFTVLGKQFLLDKDQSFSFGVFTAGNGKNFTETPSLTGP